MTDSPLIIGFVADLMFSVRIEQAARQVGCRVQWIESAEQLGEPDELVPQRQVGEHLVGPGAVLIDQLTLLNPALLIFDLDNHAIPWLEWIRLITSVPATRRIPVLCFGSHKDVESIKAAREAGAQAVVARSRFVSVLPELIEKHARQVDPQAMAAACQEPLSELALRGLELFNRGEYFEAHERLEDAWNEDPTPARELYRAILQVGVAYYHIERGNYNGAIKLFLRVRQWLDALPDACRGVNVAGLRRDAQAAHQALTTLGPERIDQFDRGLFKPVQYTH